MHDSAERRTGTPLQLKGLGSKRLAGLAQLGIVTLEDLSTASQVQLSQASEALRVPISQVMNWQQQAQAQVGVSTGGVGGALLSIGLPTPQVPLQTLKPSVVQPIVNPVIPSVGVATQSGSNGVQSTSTTPTVQANPVPTARPTPPVSSPVTASPSAGSRGVQPVTQPNIPPRQSTTQSISPTSGSDSPQQVTSQPKPTSVANPNNPSVRAVRTSSGVVLATSQARPRPQPNPVQKPVPSSDSTEISTPVNPAGGQPPSEVSPKLSSTPPQESGKLNPLAPTSTSNPKADEA
jgi:hypothetical protein